MGVGLGMDVVLVWRRRRRVALLGVPRPLPRPCQALLGGLDPAVIVFAELCTRSLGRGALLIRHIILSATMTWWSRVSIVHRHISSKFPVF